MTLLDQIRIRLADLIRPAAPEPQASVPSGPDVDRDVHTLDHWRRRFAQLPRTIECPAMQLIVHDAEPPIFTGPGRIELKSETDIRFYLHGTTSDIRRAIETMRIAKENPFDHLSQFRLFATDYRNNEWACGYTEIDFYTDHDRDWPLSGRIDQLHTGAEGFWVSKSSSVELLIVPPIDLPVSEHLKQVAQIGADTVLTSVGPGRHDLDVLGSKIRFSYEPSGQALWITAQTSEDLPHPYLEGWLAEPLRILLGDPVVPRMIARNFGDGTAQVSLICAKPFREPSAAALHVPFVMHENRFESFWGFYADILRVLARDKVFGVNPLTRLFDELAAAIDGSRWVLTMTLANIVEALADSLMSEADRKSEFPDARLESIKAHIKAWTEDNVLRDRLLNSLGMIRKRSVRRFLRDLVDWGDVVAGHVEAWYEVRNAVMHGNPVSPWSTEEGETALNNMLKLVHALATMRIRRDGQAHPALPAT